MFYKQFLEITDILNPDFVNNFDYWITTLPTNNQKNITASVVSSRLEVTYSQADAILKYAERKGILEKYYLVPCPDCGYNLATVKKDDIADILLEAPYCDDCNNYKKITPEDIYAAYKIILKPDVTEAEIERAIEKRLNQNEDANINFTNADSLKNDKFSLYEGFYNPSESAYNKLMQMKADLDKDYGKDKTAKGRALEKLILQIFNEIKFVKCSDEIHTETNQFDCTVLCGIGTCYPTIFNQLSPYFIVECKNEKKKPGNTYFNKLLSIMNSNEAQFGVVCSRKRAARTCFTIARENYLINQDKSKQRIIICFDDSDLEYLIDKRVNLLQYLEFKKFQVTTNSPTSTWEKFKQR